MVDITGLDKAEVLKELYNASKVQGMGFSQATGKDITLNEARAELYENDSKYFDYLHGKIMKISLKSNTEFNPAMYDRDNGEGAAQFVIDLLRQKN